MAQKLDPKELVTFKELQMANSIQTDALAQLLIEKGNHHQGRVLCEAEQIQTEYEEKKPS